MTGTFPGAWQFSYLGLDGGLGDRGDVVSGDGEALRHGLQCGGPHRVLRQSGHGLQTSCKINRNNVN